MELLYFSHAIHLLSFVQCSDVCTIYICRVAGKCYKIVATEIITQGLKGSFFVCVFLCC